jgi:hypothetical protein
MDFTRLRRFPRSKVDFLVTYETGGKKRRARAMMLGGNGLLLQVSESLLPGTELTVRFCADKRRPPIEAIADVRYHSRVTGLGVEFKRIKPQDRKTVLDTVLSSLRNKRINPPKPLVVQVQHDEGSFLAFSRNISVGGMFVATKDVMLVPGSGIALRFPMDDAGPTIATQAEVRYAVATQGMGTKFLGIKQEDLSRIDMYVTKGESSMSAMAV